MRNASSMAVRPIPSILTSLRDFAIVIAMVVAGLAVPSWSARAATSDEKAADVAVDLFVKGGQAAGLPLNDYEAGIVKSVVICAAGGANVVDCAKNMFLKTALEKLGTNPAISSDIVKATDCLLKGTNANTCVNDALVKQLPAEAQPMASCVINGEGNLAECSKKFTEAMILSKVPEDVRPVASCLIETRNATKCTTDFIVAKAMSNMPPEAKAIVTCLGNTTNPVSCASSVVPPEIKPLFDCATAPGGNVQKCAAEFAASKLPDNAPGAASAKALVNCLGTTNAIGDCAKTVASNAAAGAIDSAQQEAIQKAIDLMNALKPGAPRSIKAGIKQGEVPATLQNIIDVADGIKRGDWAQVVEAAGPELAILASQIILSIFLTPPVAGLLGPAVEAMIHNDAAYAQAAMKALADGDAVEIAKLGFTWYESRFFEAPCALTPDGKVKAAVCGGLSDALDFVADNASDLAKKLLGVGKDILEWLGVWGTVDDLATGLFNRLKGAVEDVGHFLGIGGDDEEFKPAADCVAPSAYYANNFVACVTGAANVASRGGNLNIAGSEQACVSKFNSCVAPDKRAAAAKSINDACHAMGDSFGNLVKQVSDGMRKAADAYTEMGAGIFAASVYGKGPDGGPGDPDMCAPNFWTGYAQQYAFNCAKFVEKGFPSVRDANASAPDSACMKAGWAPPPANSGTSVAARQACIAALAANANKSKIAGPDSGYCKRQEQAYKELAEKNPCEIKLGRAVVHSYMDFNLVEPTLDCRTRPMPGGFDMRTSLGNLKLPTSLGGSGGRRTSFPWGGDLILPIRQVIKFPDEFRLPPIPPFGGLAGGLPSNWNSSAARMRPGTIFKEIPWNVRVRTFSDGTGGIGLVGRQIEDMARQINARIGGFGGPAMGAPAGRDRANSGGSGGIGLLGRGDSQHVDPRILDQIQGRIDATNRGGGAMGLPAGADSTKGRAASSGGGGIGLAKGGGEQTPAAGARKGNSAMDRLGSSATDAALGGVAGSAGGPAMGLPSGGRSAPTKGGYGSVPVPPVVGSAPSAGAAPSGGTGGIGTVNNRSNEQQTRGGGSGGIGTVNNRTNEQQQNRSNAASQIRNQQNPVNPPAQNRSAPSVDDRIDYGGCSSCGTRNEPLRVR